MAGSTTQAASIPARQPRRPLSGGVNLSCCVGSFVLKFRRIFVTIAELTLGNTRGKGQVCFGGDAGVVHPGVARLERCGNVLHRATSHLHA